MGHITDVAGISVGHVTDAVHHTGVTAVLFSHAMPCGVDVRGGGPGTRETDALGPLGLVETADAVVLAGGSAFGLDAASGAMRWLKERGRGVQTGFGNVPIVSAAVIFDLPVGGGKVTPTEEWGYRACEAASENDSSRGNVGAGTGATVGKLYGMEWATKSGLGSASVTGAGGLIVGAIAVVNALGSIIDPESGSVIAGTLARDKKSFADPRALIREVSYPFVPPGSSTIIAVVAVSARFSKLDMSRIARMAHDGIARASLPSHTMLDGDTIFAVSAGAREYVDVSICGSLAALSIEYAIADAVRSADSAAGLPAARDIAE